MTKTTAPSDALAELERRRDELHAEARTARAERDGHDAETAALRAELTQHRNEHPEDYFGGDFRPKPGTRAAELDAAIKARVAAPNPGQPAYDAAIAEFHAADAAVEEFHRTHIDELIAEHDERVDAAVASLHAGLEQLIEGADAYAAAVAGVRDIIVNCPVLGGQHLGYDPRPAEWGKLADLALGSAVARPGLNDAGRARLAELARVAR